MLKDPVKTDATVEPTATPSAPVSSTSEPITTGDIFDFTVGVEVMDGPTKSAYYRVRRSALIRGDATLLPEGKKMSRREIEEIIGGELGKVEGPRPCCA
jgi:hypothetical protein